MGVKKQTILRGFKKAEGNFISLLYCDLMHPSDGSWRTSSRQSRFKSNTSYNRIGDIPVVDYGRLAELRVRDQNSSLEHFSLDSV